jgi:DNA-binding SARP family transcriptional activator/sugar lactone lactonase YvrE
VVTNELEFRVLGPLQVAANGSVLPLGGAKQRAVLALLVFHANELVSLDRLIDELWGESPPDSAANLVQGYVSRLRKELEPGRARGEHELLVSRPPGYVLRLRPEQLDSENFARLSTEGRRLLNNGDPDDAAGRLREALALWRGPPLADLAYESFARAEVERLEELRLAALEDRIAADLALDRHAELVGELRELVAEHPLRERLRAQLMVALYRSGRQAEALEVFRDARRTLSEELGIEPGPALRELERAILQQDPALGASEGPPLEGETRSRRLWLAIAAALLAVAAAAAGVLATRGGSGTPAPVTVYPHSVAVIDPAKNRLVDDVIVGAYPIALTADARFVYVSNSGDATLSRIDAKTRKVVDTGALSRATDLIAMKDHLWTANGGAPGHVAIPPGTVTNWEFGSAAMRTIRVGPNVAGDEQQTTLASDGDFALWAGNADSETVREIDPSLDRTVRTIHGVAPGGLAVVGNSRTGDTVWASEPSKDRVVEIDGNSGRILRRIHVSGRPTRLAADEDDVWVLTRGTRHAVTRISARTGKTVASIPLPVAPNRVLLAQGGVWVSGARRTDYRRAQSSGGMVVRIDPKTNRIDALIPLGDVGADGLVLARGLLWVGISPYA